MSRSNGRDLEIACDESGFSGGNLVGVPGRVFAHAGVRVSRPVADDLVDHVRRQIAGPPTELKSARLLRPRHRDVARWLLGPHSPLYGNARVHLTDTWYFVLARLVDVLTGPGPVPGTSSPGVAPPSRALAVMLYEQGPRAYGSERWTEFLSSGANLFRTNNRWLPKAPVEVFFTLVDQMLRTSDDGPVTDALRQFATARAVATSTRASHEQNPKLTPLMEPVIPALARTVDSWGGADETNISVVHDEQSALTPERLGDIAAAFAARHPGHRLTGVRLVDSRTDPRVQIADLLAGIARHQAGIALAGGAGGELAVGLAPYVLPESTWADTRSWSVLSAR